MQNHNKYDNTHTGQGMEIMIHYADNLGTAFLNLYFMTNSIYFTSV